MSLTPCDIQRIEEISQKRLLKYINWVATGIVNNPNGAGRGTASAGSDEEHKLARAIGGEMEKIGLKVKYEPAPVETYEYSPMSLTANGKRLDAISLYGASAVYGTRYGNYFSFGNANDGKAVVGQLVYGGTGTLPELKAVPGGVAGKVVLIQRNYWPVYQIIEAKNQGALALIIGGGADPEIRPELINQDSFYHHLQLPVAAVSGDVLNDLKEKITQEPVEITLKSKMIVKDGKSYTVVGKIKGRKHPDQYIVISGHYDRWFDGAADNAASIGGILELARFFKNGPQPDRTILFIAMPAEEAGIYQSESDWLAGSLAYIQNQPEIIRRSVMIVNLEAFGWTSEEIVHFAHPELLPFIKEVVAAYPGTLKNTVREQKFANNDSWTFGRVGGGSVYSPRTVNSAASDPKYYYWQYYHTDGDIFEPDRFQAAAPVAKVIAAAMLMADRRKIVPVDFNPLIESFNGSLAISTAANPDIDYSEVVAARDEFAAEVKKIKRHIAHQCGVEQLNNTLLNVRKEIIPWLYSLGLYRVSMYDHTYQRIKALLEAAKTNNVDATLKAILEMSTSGGGWWALEFSSLALFSEKTVEEQRLYYYTNDWKTYNDQRQKLIGADIDKMYYRLKRGETTPLDELPLIEDEVGYVRVLLKETLAVTAGFLRRGAHLLRTYV